MTKRAGQTVFPFSAIVGQDDMKLALILNAINPLVGGVLVRGEKGTAKSTTVRALAALLPDIDVIEGCPFSCEPGREAGLCETCLAENGSPAAARRKVSVVDLPLNATEDMVLGSIDFSLAVKSGVRRFRPGLLARAHRGIVYVDEVNLLDDHIVDIILDAASSGENVVEREGVSVRHPSEFILVGTMNPEEGELRPQLLDRFGLAVLVVGEESPQERVKLMELRERFDNDPDAFRDLYSGEEQKLKSKIEAARAMAGDVFITPEARKLITEICMENNVAGHRADIVLERAACALAAFEGRSEVVTDDIKKIAPMALLHRRRDAAPPPPPPEHEHEHEHEHDNSEQDSQEQQQPDNQEQDSQENSADEQQVEQQPDDGEADAGETEMPAPPDSASEKVFDVGDTFKVKSFSHEKDRMVRRGSGRRSRTRTSQKQGRYVKSSLRNPMGDIALDATLRAAAPFQKSRDANGLAVAIRDSDIRGKIREKRVGNFLVFLVDGSGSMGARSRMVATKGAVLSLLLDAYQKRDRVAMVVFRKQEAEVVLPPTSSIELAGKMLRELPVGGRTPLSDGLVKAFRLMKVHLLKEPAARPICIIITDGKSNVALGDGKPREEIMRIAENLVREPRIKYIVVDTETSSFVNFGLAAGLAASLHADHLKIDELKAKELIDIVRSIT